MKNYLKNFIENEEGVELFEFGILVVIAAGLIGVALILKDKITEGMNNAVSDVDTAMGNGGSVPTETGN